MVDLRMTSFGDLLKTARRRQRFTQGQLAARVGVHLNTLGAWERGDYLPATRGLVLDLAQQLQLDKAETRQFLEASLTALAPYWTVPFPRNPCFTGREVLLEHLHASLSAERPIALTQSYALSGLGGIGKTQLALEYAYRYALNYSAVFWLAAETSETLLVSLQQIAEVLQLPVRQEAEQMRLVADVRRWLSAHRDWLLIGDNVEDVDLFQSVLPPARQGAILLTTRLQALSTLAEGLEVPPMSHEEGSALVARRVKRLHFPGAANGQSKAALSPDEAAAASSLVKLLEGLPLALDQAGAYMEETGCSVADYLQRYLQSRQPLLARRGIAAAHHPASVTTTVRLALEQVGELDSAAADLLKVCAFLQPEAIPEELLVTGAAFWGPVLEAVAPAPAQLDQALAVLRRFSLVSRYAEAHTLAVHRLVQAVIQDDLDPATRKLWSERVLRAVNAAMPQGDFGTWPESERLLPHAILCVARLEQGDEVLPEATDVLSKAGTYLVERGRYLEAEPLLLQAVACCEAQHGTEHPTLIPLLLKMGTLQKSLAKYGQAETNLLRALSLAERVPEDPQMSKALGELADLFWQQGKVAEAAWFGQRALVIVERQWGPGHPETANSLANLATYQREKGEYAQAEGFFLRALAICEQQLGEEHPQTTETRTNFALLALAQGHLELARQVFQRVLALRERIFGPNHPETAHSLNNLALVFFKQGHYAEALPLFLRALEIKEQQLGPEHPQTAMGMNNLAALYREQGHYAVALPLFLRALALQEQQPGPTSPLLGYPLNNLALLYRATGEYEQAEAAGERALCLREQQWGGDHPLTATSLSTLASVYHAQGKLEQARLLYQRAWVVCEQRLGPSHPRTLQARQDAVSIGENQAVLSPHGYSVLSASINGCSVLDRSLDQGAKPQASQIPSLVAAFARVPDQRSAQGQRHPMAAVLAQLTAALLSDAKTLRAVARWGRCQGPEVVQALGFRGNRTPAVSTLHAALKNLEGAAYEAALVSWVQQMLADKEQGQVSLEPGRSRRHDEELPGAGIIAAYDRETKRVLLYQALAKEN
jgi:tetratricopeptide (TPR) repeat protein/DNA-binding XRE family transcriptional regulator